MSLILSTRMNIWSRSTTSSMMPHRLTLTYFNTAGNTTVFPGSGNVPWATQDFRWRQHNLNISDVWVMSSDKINQVWLTYSRNFGGRNNVPATSLKDLGSSFSPQGAPSLAADHSQRIFHDDERHRRPVAGTNMYSVRDVFSWTSGRHALKVGGELSLEQGHPGHASQ